VMWGLLAIVGMGLILAFGVWISDGIVRLKRLIIQSSSHDG
jgi:hypothetical protein